MSNPVIVSLPANQWTKVASDIKIGNLYIGAWFQRNFQRTYRKAGDAAPTDQTDAIQFSRDGFEEINSADPIDYYIYNKSTFGMAGKVLLFDTGSFRKSTNEPRHTPPLDLYFLQALGPPTTLTVAADCTGGATKTITISDPTLFTAGTYVGLFSGDGRFYFGTQIGPPVGNVITLDTPLDTDFDIGDNVLPATRNLAVDGSTTTQIFQIGSTGSDIEVDITRIAGYILDTVAMDDARFGGQTALLNGIVLRQSNGRLFNFWNAKSNGDLALLSASDLRYTDKAPAGFNGARFRNTWAGEEKHGTTVLLKAGETLEVLIQDNLTALTLFNLIAMGNIIE